MTDPKGPLDEARVSTIFEGNEYRYFRWETRSPFDLTSRGKLADFRLPLVRVDAACVNPLDGDLAWLFDCPWVCDVRISTGTIVGLHTFLTHPIFRKLPDTFPTVINAVTLDGRCEEDLKPQPLHTASSTPAPSVWASVSVTSPDGIDPDGTIHVVRNVPREISLNLTFAEDGDYTVSVPKSALRMYDAWNIELRQTNNQDVSSELALKGIAKDQSISVVLRVFAHAPESVSQTPVSLEPQRPFLLSIRGKRNQLHQVRYKAQLQKTLLPRIYVYAGNRRATLELTSLRGARLTEDVPFTPAVQGSLRTCINGCGPSARETFQLSAEQRAAIKPGAEPEVKAATGWFEAPKREPSAFLQAELRPASGVTISAVPGASVPAGWLMSPPETQEVIEGFRDPSLDDDHDAWWASLPACSSNNKHELPVRMQRFIERIYKTPTKDIPDFLRTFLRVYAKHGQYTLAYYAMPDFLSVGGDQNFIRLPISGWVASEIARTLGCILPTGRMALQIYTAESTQRLFYIYEHTLEKTQTALYLTHHRKNEAERQRQRYVLGKLTSGHHKELAISPGMFDLEARQDTGSTPSYPVVFWGGVYRYDRHARQIALSQPGPDNAMRSVDAESANVGAAKGIWHPNYHDEYAQAARFISTKAYLRTGTGAWKPVDLVKEVLASSDLHPLISTSAMSDPYLPKDPHCPRELVIPPPSAAGVT